MEQEEDKSVNELNSSNDFSIILDNSTLNLLHSTSNSTSNTNINTHTLPNFISDSNPLSLSKNIPINTTNNVIDTTPSAVSTSTSATTSKSIPSLSSYLNYINDPSPDEVSDSPLTVLNIFPLSKLNRTTKPNSSSSTLLSTTNSSSSTSISSQSQSQPQLPPNISQSPSTHRTSNIRSLSNSSHSTSNTTNTSTFSSTNISDRTKNTILVNHLLTKKMIEDHIAAEDELLALQTNLLSNPQQLQQQYDQFY